MDSIVFIVLFYLVIIILVLGAIWYYQEQLFKTTPVSQGGGLADKLSSFTIPNSWSTPQPIISSKNNCNIYRFNYGIAPSYANVESKSGISQTLPVSSDTCLDPDSITAQLYQRTCVSEDPYPCVTFNSEKANIGQTETFAGACGQLNSCVGLFGTIYIGNCSGASINCTGQCISTITSNNKTNLNLSNNCTPNPTVNSSNLFRIERAIATTVDTPNNSGGFTSTVSFTPNSSGLYSRIIHRESGLYLSPVIPKDSKGNLLPNKVLAGSSIILTDEKSLPNQGYIWALVDPLPGYIQGQLIVYSPSGTNFPPNVGLQIPCKTPCSSGSCQKSGICTNNVSSCYYNPSVSQGSDCPPNYTKYVQGTSCECNTFQTWYNQMIQDGNDILYLSVASGKLTLRQFTLSTDNQQFDFSTILDYSSFTSEYSKVNSGSFPFFISVN